MKPADTPMISIIMPVRNERRTLAALLDSIVHQIYPSECFEVLVADGRSDDGTRELVNEYGKSSRVPVILIDNPGIRSGPGRSAGVRSARGDYIIFIDGHCHIPSSTLLLDTVRIFRESQADCLCRPQPLLAPSSSRGGEIIANVRASTLGHGRDSLIYDMTYTGFVDPASSGASYRKQVFAAIGMYDEDFDACEDVEFNTRLRKAGMKAYTHPALTVYYEPRSSLKSLFLQMMRYGRGRVRLARKHPDGVSISQFAPLVLLISFAGAALSLAVVPLHLLPAWMLILFCIPVLFYLAVVLASSVGLARKYRLDYLLEGPPVFLAIHLGLGAGMFLEAVRRGTGTAQSTLAKVQKGQAG